MQATNRVVLHDALTRAFRQLTAAFSARADRDPSAMRRPDYALLGVIERHESLHGTSLRPSDLAASDGHDLSTVSRRIGALVGQGWLVREPDPADRRACRVALTDEGRSRLLAERDARAAVVTDVLADWTEEDTATLARLLERLSDDVAASRTTSPATATAPSPSTDSSERNSA